MDEEVFLKDLLQLIREEILKDLDKINSIKIEEPLHDKWMSIFDFLSKKWPNESPARNKIESFYRIGLDKFKPSVSIKSEDVITRHR